MEEQDPSLVLPRYIQIMILDLPCECYDNIEWACNSDYENYPRDEGGDCTLCWPILNYIAHQSNSKEAILRFMND